MDKNSMLYWYPKIKGLTGIRQPKTEIIEFKEDDLPKLMEVCDGNFEVLEPYMQEINAKADKIGYPLFMRTDQLSNKHDWKNSCYCTSKEHILSHIANLVEASLMADMLGIDVRALILREYIPMKNMFTAFWGDLPINPEIRFFVKDGKALCNHWYWVEDAIRSPSNPRWREIMESWKKRIQPESLMPMSDLLSIAIQVSNCVPGAWSVDFCLSRKEGWVLIDMAEAEKSWHPSHEK